MIQDKKVLAIIPARANSKRLKNKNIKNFCGKPLIHWTIKQAKNCSLIDKVVVSTDSEKIKNISIESGAEVPFLRPRNLAKDDSKTNDTVIHLLENIKYFFDIIILLQPTSPLRKNNHIIDALNYFMQEDEIESLVSIKTKSNIISNKKKLIFNLFDESTLNLNEKKLPKSFYPNGSIYISSKSLFLKNKTFYTEKTYLYLMDNKYSIDIDYDKDFLYAEELFKKL